METPSNSKQKDQLPANCSFRTIEGGVQAEYNFTATRSETKLCTNEGEAKQWLQQMVKDNQK
jgi:hypothetical protein